MRLNTDNAQKVLNLYYKRVLHIIKPLSKKDQQDIQMELESHIYESMLKHPKEDEVSTLLFALEKLGEPGFFLNDVVAERKLAQAGKTFNPLHIASALALNIGRGFIKSILFIIISLLYLLSFTLFVLGILKPIFPSKIGWFAYPDSKRFFIGWMGSNALPKTELLGNLFTPVVIIIAIFIYVIITVLLKIVPKKTKISA